MVALVKSGHDIGINFNVKNIKVGIIIANHLIDAISKRFASDGNEPMANQDGIDGFFCFLREFFSLANQLPRYRVCLRLTLLNKDGDTFVLTAIECWCFRFNKLANPAGAFIDANLTNLAAGIDR